MQKTIQKSTKFGNLKLFDMSFHACFLLFWMFTFWRHALWASLYLTQANNSIKGVGAVEKLWKRVYIVYGHPLCILKRKKCEKVCSKKNCTHISVRGGIRTYEHCKMLAFQRPELLLSQPRCLVIFWAQILHFKLHYKHKKLWRKKAQWLRGKILTWGCSTICVLHYIFAEMCGNEEKRSYEHSSENLLYQKKFGGGKIFFLHAKKIFFFNFFFLIPVKTFKQGHKEPVFNLTWFSILEWTNS